MPAGSNALKSLYIAPIHRYRFRGGLLRIALDLDGVLADTMRLWIRLWRYRTGQIIRFEDLDEWDFWKKLGISEGEFMDIMNDAWRLWKIMPPTETLLSEKVKEIKKFGKVDIVTARPRVTERYVLNWLERHKIPYDEYVWIRSCREKPSLNYDVYIDDSPLIVDGCIRRRKLLILYHRPWNKLIQENIYVKRIKSLDEVPEILGRLKHEG